MTVGLPLSYPDANVYGIITVDYHVCFVGFFCDALISRLKRHELSSDPWPFTTNSGGRIIIQIIVTLLLRLMAVSIILIETWIICSRWPDDRITICRHWWKQVTRGTTPLGNIRLLNFGQRCDVSELFVRREICARCKKYYQWLHLVKKKAVL